MNAAAAPIRVVGIVALSHSGSHLLSQLLGAHSRCLSIGELHNYDKLVNRRKSGNVTDDYAENDIFAGLERLPDSRWHEQVFSNAQARYPTVMTLIDNSKRPSWFRRLAKQPHLEILPVHLVRDPRAMVRYWMLRYDSDRLLRRQRLRLARAAPREAAALIRCPPLELYIRKWLIDNRDATRLLTATGYPANVVTYHDLSTATERTLTTLMPKLGLAFEPAQLRYGEAAQHGTLKRDYRAASEASRIDLDLRWQTFLAESEARTVATDGRIRTYLEGLGLALTPQGLTATR